MLASSDMKDETEGDWKICATRKSKGSVPEVVLKVICISNLHMAGESGRTAIGKLIGTVPNLVCVPIAGCSTLTDSFIQANSRSWSCFISTITSHSCSCLEPWLPALGALRSQYPWKSLLVNGHLFSTLGGIHTEASGPVLRF